MRLFTEAERRLAYKDGPCPSCQGIIEAAHRRFRKVCNTQNQYFLKIDGTDSGIWQDEDSFVHVEALFETDLDHDGCLHAWRANIEEIMAANPEGRRILREREREDLEHRLEELQADDGDDDDG